MSESSSGALQTGGSAQSRSSHNRTIELLRDKCNRRHDLTIRSLALPVCSQKGGASCKSGGRVIFTSEGQAALFIIQGGSCRAIEKRYFDSSPRQASASPSISRAQGTFPHTRPADVHSTRASRWATLPVAARVSRVAYAEPIAADRRSAPSRPGRRPSRARRQLRSAPWESERT